jgi:hypothetical protein
MPKVNTRFAKILTEAITKTDQVQEELHDVAEALGEANAVLSSPLSTAQAVSAAAGAVQQAVLVYEVRGIEGPLVMCVCSPVSKCKDARRWLQRFHRADRAAPGQR